MTTIEELESRLINGFHDAQICRLTVDYERGEAVMRVQVDVSDPDEAKRPRYRTGVLHIKSLLMFSMDVPDSISATKSLWIDAGPGQPPKSPVQLPALPPDCFLHWFFVNEWNGFIRVAARDAEFKWVDEVELAS